MKVLTFDSDIPERAITHAGNNRPELRQTLILEALKNKNYNINIIEPAVDIPNFLNNYISKDYIEFLKNAYQNAHNSNDNDWFVDDSLLPDHFIKNFDNYLLTRLPLYKLSGWYCNDRMTPILSSTWINIIKSLNTCISAAKLSFRERNITYALVNSPGHHATFDSYGGYCFLNNGAATALKFLSLGLKKGVILDVDYHHGDGTQKIFYNTNQILTISLHANPINDYPSFYGYKEENGNNEGLGFNINYPLEKGTKWDDYKNNLMEALIKIDNFNPDFFIIAFGADTYKDDLDASHLGKFQLTVDNYFEMGKLINSHILNRPTVITQEGGYNMEHIGEIITNFLDGLTFNTNSI